MIRPRRALTVVAVAATPVAACATHLNYVDPSGPRYAGVVARTTLARDTLKVVTFNVEFARHVGAAIRLLQEDEALRDADVLCLQEMDEAGAQAIADSVGLNFVYYPSTVHPVSNRDFGNAVLSRYPIEDDRKILMPHRQRFRHTVRSATAVTIRVGDRRLRVYSIHIATFVGNGPRARREQLAAVLADADGYPQVVVAGDFNSASVPDIALRRGFIWPTRRLGRTSWLWDMDHVLLKGVALAGDSAAGMVRRVHGASDHRPVWARIVLPAATPSPPTVHPTPPPTGEGTRLPGAGGAAPGLTSLPAPRGSAGTRWIRACAPCRSG